MGAAHETSGDYTMKRKYWIEAGVAAVVLFILLLIMVPKFLKIQTQAQPAALQKYVEEVVVYLANNQDDEIYQQFDKKRKRYTSRSMRCYTHGKSVYLLDHFYYFDGPAFYNLMSDIQNPRWAASDVYFAVAKTHLRNSTEYDTTPCDENEFNEKPYVISCVAIVGNNHSLTARGMHSPSHINNVEFDDRMSSHILDLVPFDISNGLGSYGEFYADTSNIWPRKKAVVMDPAPEDSSLRTSFAPIKKD
jgi:hypothetical protein